MARSKKGSYKYNAGDKIGLYEVIKALPSEPTVRNLRMWCRCILCGEKCLRFSNRLDSKHRNCKSDVKVKKGKIVPPKEKIKPVVVETLPHLRADGSVVQTDEQGFVVDPVQEVADATPDDPESEEQFSLPETLDLPDEVKQALDVDVNQQAIEIIRKADGLDTSTKFIFINTFKRYLTLVHIARQLESKMNRADVELTIIGSTGKQVANPLIVQYKQVSAESNATIKILLTMVTKMTAGDQADDPLLNALRA